MHRHQLTSFEAGQDAAIQLILDAGPVAIPYLAAMERQHEFATEQDQWQTFGQPAAKTASTSLLSQGRRCGKEVLAALAARLRPAHAADMGSRPPALPAPLRLL